MREVILKTPERAADTRKISPAGRKLKGWIRALYFCGIGGLLLGLTGLSMSGAAYFGFAENAKTINQIGTWLIVLAFPLVMFGAHAMDKIAAIQKAEKRAAFEAEEKRGLYNPEQWKKDE